MFARSTKKLTEEIKRAVPEAKIEVNAEKPGKGNFIVSVDGESVLSLKALPRPFKALRECDLVAVADKVVAKLL